MPITAKLANGEAEHDPLSDLPFVYDDPTWTVEKGRETDWGPRSYWNVSPTGETAKDSDMGNELARAALDYIAAHDGNPVLGWVVLSMLRQPEKAAGEDRMVIVGFMGEVARYAAWGRKVLRSYEELKPGGMIAIMKDPRSGRMMGVFEEVYAEPEVEARNPV